MNKIGGDGSSGFSLKKSFALGKINIFYIDLINHVFSMFFSVLMGEGKGMKLKGSGFDNFYCVLKATFSAQLQEKRATTCLKYCLNLHL